jgi:DNA polymerase III alpha subunit
MLVHNCVGGPLAFDIFQELQGIEFDALSWKLLDNPTTMSRVLARIGSTWERLTDAVGRENAHLELQFNKLSAQHLANRALIEFARREGITDKLIVTCDSHYARPEHWREREIYKKLGRLNYETFNPEGLPRSVEELKCELYPKNAKQVWETYQETRGDAPFYDNALVSDAVERTWDIAHNFIGNVQPDRSVKLPTYVIPEGKTAMKALIDACKDGLVKRGLQNSPEYIARLKYELEIIKEKKFSEYFLTMKAIIDLARDHMLVGPGRGSGAGSLVNYVLYITDVDPVEYGLLFERFLSIDRSEYPDIDSDISDRDALIRLMREKFGSENIIPISNYNTFKLKSLIKDVSRFYGIPFEEVNKALASLERDVAAGAKYDDDADEGIDVTLEDALKYSSSTRAFLESHPDIMDPLQVLFKQNKSLGRHAGGVIVSERIGERMPLIMAKGERQTPWVEGMNYKHLEEFGWVKFDLLGLGTLRMIERTIELILEKEGRSNITFADVRDWFDRNMSPKVIDFNDQKVYEYVYHSGRWAGIFQCTNRGAQELFMSAKPASIIDLATLTSIYRPGPLGAKVDKLFIKSKSDPSSVHYGHPLIEQVLGETYSCLHGDAVITTEDGDLTIREIVEKQLVGSKLPSLNEATGEIEQDTIVAAVCTGYKDTIEIEVEDGRSIRLTSDHRVYTLRGWVEAGNLTLDDEILGIEALRSIAPLKIKSIKRSEPSPVYDIQVQKNHNFIANGLIVHNCIIFQEQVMELCHVVAGFPKAECNKIRKMMKPVGSGNENVEKARALKEKFVKGSVANGIDEKTADKLYENICYFSGYGFNKSHAVAYAMNSYYCAWLMTYYEQEWLISYLEATAGSKKAPKAIAEVKGLGYKIVPIDINFAKKSWTAVGDHKLMPSFLSCKGLGLTSIDEIVALRPYTSVDDMLWNPDGTWRHSKFNRKAFESLVKIRAFDSMGIVGPGCTFSSYRQMHDIVIGEFDALKKRLKKDPHYGKRRLRELIAESTEAQEWSVQAKMEFDRDLLGSFNIESAIPESVAALLKSREIQSLDDYQDHDIYWFMVVNSTMKMTKGKKPYLLLECIAGSGKVHRVFCWSTPEGVKLDSFTFLIAEVEKGDFGMSTRWQKIKAVSLEK